MISFLSIVANTINLIMRKVSICVTRSDTIGGVHVYILNLISTLKNSGYTPEVVCSFSQGSPFLSRLDSEGVKYTICPTLSNRINLISDILSLIFLYKYFRRLPLNGIVHIHSSKIGF